MQGPFQNTTSRIAVGAWAALLLIGAAATKPSLDTTPYIHAQRLVDIGGRRLNLYCTGSGTPTVILDAGAGDTIVAWRAIQPEVARRTRVCSYDRAGLGFSDAGPLPRDGDAAVNDLHTLLTRAAIGSPYVLVSHSLGGLYARLYADRYPNDVAGLVLVEPGVEFQVKQIASAAPALAQALAEGIPMDRKCAASAAGGEMKPGTKAFGACIAPPDPALPKALNDLHTEQWERAATWRDYASEDEASGTSTSVQVQSAQRRYGSMPLIVVTASNPIADLDAFPLPKAQRAALLHFAWDSRVRISELSSRGSIRIAKGCNHEDIITKCASVVTSAINDTVDAAFLQR